MTLGLATIAVKGYYQAPSQVTSRSDIIADAVNASVRYYGLEEYAAAHTQQGNVWCVHLGSGEPLWVADDKSRHMVLFSYDYNRGMVNEWLFGLMVPVTAVALGVKVSTTKKENAEDPVVPPRTTYSEYLKSKNLSQYSGSQSAAVRYAAWEAAKKYPRPLPQTLLGEPPW